MENEFIFTAMFAVLLDSCAVLMLVTALVLKFKLRTMSQKAYNKWADAMYLSFFLWKIFFIAMMAAFGVELTIKMM